MPTWKEYRDDKLWKRILGLQKFEMIALNRRKPMNKCHSRALMLEIDYSQAQMKACGQNGPLSFIFIIYIKWKLSEILGNTALLLMQHIALNEY